MDFFVIIAIIIQLIFLEGILSIDNAAVLGAMVAVLPEHDPVPWPHSLQKLGKALERVLGPQRTAGLRVGLLGAYVGRGLMLTLASIIVQNPWIKLVGALYLIHLAFDSLGVADEGEDDAHIKSLDNASFWMVVLNVELADLAFSIDNVIAAVSLSKMLWVVIIGVAIGILAMRFAAGLFTYAVLREPILKQAAYILVLNIGLQLILEEYAGLEINDWLRFGMSLAIIGLSLAYAHAPNFIKKILDPVFNWLGRGFADINELIDWLLEPITGLFKLIFNFFKIIFAGSSKRDVISQ
jgi:tellurite resistance protein TerC